MDHKLSGNMPFSQLGYAVFVPFPDMEMATYFYIVRDIYYTLSITVKSKSILSRKKHHMHGTLTEKKKARKGRGECAMHIA